MNEHGSQANVKSASAVFVRNKNGHKAKEATISQSEKAMMWGIKNESEW